MDLEKELQALTAQAPEGEEARHGEFTYNLIIFPYSNPDVQWKAPIFPTAKKRFGCPNFHNNFLQYIKVSLIFLGRRFFQDFSLSTMRWVNANEHESLTKKYICGVQNAL